MDLTFFVRAQGELYRRFSETHIQKAHAPEHLAGLLEANGFGQIEIFGDKTFAPPDAQETRNHIAAARID